jgi:hypothetical protein
MGVRVAWKDRTGRERVPLPAKDDAIIAKE